MDTLEERRTRPAKSNVNPPLRETASQTAGPYLHIGCASNQAGLETLRDDERSPLASADQGSPVHISGHVFDGAGEVCKDIMLEFWHCDALGNYSPGIWKRTLADLQTGFFSVSTSLPGPVHLANGEILAPFMNIWLAARGINMGLMTRMYFPQFQDHNRNDPHLKMVEPSRRATLVAELNRPDGHYRFDIYLQGEGETVFFRT